MHLKSVEKIHQIVQTKGDNSADSNYVLNKDPV